MKDEIRRAFDEAFDAILDCPHLADNYGLPLMTSRLCAENGRIECCTAVRERKCCNEAVKKLYSVIEKSKTKGVKND